MNDYMVIYGDQTVADSRKDEHIPRRDVQIIVQQHPDVGWHTQSGYDYYIRWDDRWTGVDLFGLFDFLLESGLVLFGRTTTQENFNQAMRVAMTILQQERQQKTGWLAGERKPD